VHNTDLPYVLGSKSKKAPAAETCCSCGTGGSNTAKHLLPVPEMGGSRKIKFFSLLWHPCPLLLSKGLLSPPLGETGRSVLWRGEGKEAWVSHREQPRALFGTWGKT